MRPIRSTARAMLSAVFVTDGARTIMRPEPLEARVRPVTDRVAPIVKDVNPRVPTRPRDFVRFNGAVQVAAGLLLGTSHLTRPAAALLVGSLVPTTLAGHPFWRESDPKRRREVRTQFLKNMGLIGGLLLATVDTEGRPNLHWRTQHLVESGRRWGRVSRRAARISPIGIIAHKLR